jgi:hypothetical protein
MDSVQRSFSALLSSGIAIELFTLVRRLVPYSNHTPREHDFLWFRHSRELAIHILQPVSFTNLSLGVTDCQATNSTMPVRFHERRGLHCRLSCRVNGDSERETQIQGKNDSRITSQLHQLTQQVSLATSNNSATKPQSDPKERAKKCPSNGPSPEGDHDVTETLDHRAPSWRCCLR